MATHSHEEADTVIPLHVLDALHDNSMKSVDVHCGDADIIMLHIDLVAHDRHGEGKVSVEKGTWMKAFLRLSDDDEVISCFQRL